MARLVYAGREYLSAARTGAGAFVRVSVASCSLAAVFLAVSTCIVMATEPGLTRLEPAQRNPAFPTRAALLIVPQTSVRSTRAAIAHVDEAEYRARLSQLGFDVIVIGPGSRLEIDRHARQAAAALPESADIAVFVLGEVLAEGADLYVVPDDAHAALESHREILATEALPILDLLRRIATRNPRSLFAFVDECRRLDRPTEPCGLSAVSASGTSMIAVHRTEPPRVCRRLQLPSRMEP